MTPTPPVIPDSSTPLDLDELEARYLTDAGSNVRMVNLPIGQLAALLSELREACAKVAELQACASPSALALLRTNQDLTREVSELREARSQQATWVKCSERMPEDEESVWICLVVSRIVGPAKYYCTADAGEFSVEEGAYPLSCVSHWMPRHVPRRPSPPEAP